MSLAVSKHVRKQFLRVGASEREKVQSKLTGAWIYDGNFVKQNNVQWMLFPT